MARSLRRTAVRPRLSVSAPAAVAAGLWIYCAEPGTAAPLLLAVAAHELGHFLALCLLGLRVTAV
nr:hypothetical protein [Oscillospiraceae bacterium]